MTSLLSGPTRPARTATAAPTDVAHRRPLVLLALLGGVAAAAGPLVVCLAVGVAGWFLSDAGAHGAPRDGLRAGAYAWLMGHGSGLTVAGVTISAIPLGVSVICAWAVWRIAHRVGDSVSGHGPDADAIADGVRDWTVPAATGLFTAAYVAVAVVTLRALAADTAPPSGTRVVLWSLLLCLVVGGASIAIGAGRAAIWTAFLPLSLRAASTVCLKVVSTFLLVSAATLLVALAIDLGAALNVMSALHTDPGEASLYSGLTAGRPAERRAVRRQLPAGPGLRGRHRHRSPARRRSCSVRCRCSRCWRRCPTTALRRRGSRCCCSSRRVAAAYAAARVHRLYPTTRWEEGAVRGCAGGILAGLVVGGSRLPRGRFRRARPDAGRRTVRRRR